MQGLLNGEGRQDANSLEDTGEQLRDCFVFLWIRREETRCVYGG